MDCADSIGRRARGGAERRAGGRAQRRGGVMALYTLGLLFFERWGLLAMGMQKAEGTREREKHAAEAPADSCSAMQLK